MQTRPSKQLLMFSAALGLAWAMGINTAQAATAAPAKHYHALTGNPSGTYRIDPEHSAAYFTIGHVGIGPFSGRFSNKVHIRVEIEGKKIA
ncbi:hypothetical protein ACJU26_02970 [Acidithiobacillus sp. M4-SHS-6]|uniref:hypothetical protein n=1 Tax=Acidithiobacillus sp. M4-SHS-6 TaxID=3383024 RepID=UPI0039BDE142